MQTRSRPPVEVQPENQNKGDLSDFDCGMVVTETTDLLGFFPTKIIFSIYKKKKNGLKKRISSEQQFWVEIPC